MPSRMRELILERLDYLRTLLPAGVTMTAFLWDEDEVRTELVSANAVIAESYGWLQGIADVEDVTVTQLVEEAEEDPVGAS